MKLFLAGEHEVKNGNKANPRGLYILESFVYAQTNKFIEHFIPYYKGFLLDSGAFSFFNGSGSTTNWREYVLRYCKFILRHNVQLFFELDIERVTSILLVEDLRKLMEDTTGRQPIPVWRPMRGLDYWHRMITTYPYVAISASGMYDSRWTRVKGGTTAVRSLVTMAHQAGSKVHGLGYTNLQGLVDIRFDSVDSTAWLYGNRGGYLYWFNGSTIKQVQKPAGTRLRPLEAAQHNFNEWVKFQQYADMHL